MYAPIRTAILPLSCPEDHLSSTIAMPQELCPVYDKTPLQVAVEEAQAAGITRLIIVTPRDDSAVRHYFEQTRGLKHTLPRAWRRALRRAGAPGRPIEVEILPQPRMRDLGDAILGARALIAANEPFAVIRPLDLILGGTPALSEMCLAYDPKRRAHMLGVTDKSSVQHAGYGIHAREAPIPGRQVNVSALVPSAVPEASRACGAGIGRFILGPGIFAALKATHRPRDGHARPLGALADAIASAIGSGDVSAFGVTGTHYDCRTADSLLIAALAARAHRHLTLRIAAE